MFQIRETTQPSREDCRRIFALGQKLCILPELLNKDHQNSDQGFLVAPYSETSLKALCASGGRIFFAETALGSELVGFLIQTTGHQFLEHYSDSELIWADCQPHYKQAFRSGQFAYLDQIGIANHYKGKGVGQSLHQAFCRDIQGVVLVSVLTRPINNTRSHRFFERLGYAPVGLFFTPNFRGIPEVYSSALIREFP